MKRRHAILLLGGASSGAMSIGTGAFSSVEADRGVSVNVVKDENAYLGLDDNAGTGFVRITNQFAGDLDLSVTATLASGSGTVGVDAEDGDITIKIEVESDEDETDDGSSTSRVDIVIPTGEAADVTGDCKGSGEQTLDVTFSGSVSDTGTTVNKSQTFTVKCDQTNSGSTGSAESDDPVSAEDVTKVKFLGGSEKVKILTTEDNGGGDGRDGNVKAKLYCEDDDGVTSSDETLVSVNEKLSSGDFDGDCEGSVVGVGINGIGVFEKSDRGNGNIVNRGAASGEPSWE